MLDLDLPPLVLALGLAMLALAAIAVHLRGWRADAASFGGSHGVPPRALRGGARALRVAALVSLAVAVAAPVRRGAEAAASSEPALVVLLDVSMSMKATDVAPSRLDEAKRQLLAGLDAPFAGRLALVAFAAEPSLVCPPTSDRAAFADLLGATAEDAALPGLSLAAPALARAVALVGNAEGDVVVISDGEFPDEDRRQLREVARDAARRGIRVSTVAVGSETGAAVPVRGSATGQVPGDDTGAPAATKVDVAVLQWLAEEGGGRFVRLEPGGRLDLAGAVERLRLSGAGRPARLHPFGPQTLFGFPLALGIVLLAADTWLSWSGGRS